MITDIYKVDSPESVDAAMQGLAKAGRFNGMGDAAAARLQTLADALLKVADGLDGATDTRLWMETKGSEAVVHMKTACVVDLAEEEKLQALSTTGENTERRGLFEKIKGVFSDMAIAGNEEINTLGYIPDMADDAYPIMWTMTPTPDDEREDWNEKAAATLRRLADSVDVGFSSEMVEIAAHMKQA